MKKPKTLTWNNQRAKFFRQMPRFSNRRGNLENRRVNEPIKVDTTDALLAHTATFPQKIRVKIFEFS